ncbi:MAG: protein-L-isoaspartate(D-aspartate) O-methyltransferase [Bacillota bacterium]|nr:protein-L-isoaspartate(D-aspartate) O-methyltransferase [Bacillota bacterium]
MYMENNICSHNPIKNKEIFDFFQELNRARFIDNEYKNYASFDQALPIGLGQTISQPSLVLEMTLRLDLNKNDKVLEIGTGSGYQTVFLAEFAQAIYTIELLEELSSKARHRLKKLGYRNIYFKVGDGSEGWPQFAPYNKIIVTAGAGQFPKTLLNQLDNNGKMLAPIGDKGHQELVLISKDENGQIIKHSFGKVGFVEFKGKYGWQ